MTTIVFDCDRCKNPVNGLHTWLGTAGFYNVSPDKAWAEYALTPKEHFVCDACIQSMPLYRERYRTETPPSTNPPKRKDESKYTPDGMRADWPR